MAGLDTAIHGSAIPTFKKVAPFRVSLFYQSNFPITLPSLQIGFPPDGIRVKRVFLEIDQSGDTVLFDKSGTDTLVVLLYAKQKIGGYSDVQGAVRLAREDIDKTSWHFRNSRSWMGGSSPPMEVLRGQAYFFAAITLISTLAPRSSLATCTKARAG